VRVGRRASTLAAQSSHDHQSANSVIHPHVPIPPHDSVNTGSYAKKASTPFACRFLRTACFRRSLAYATTQSTAIRSTPRSRNSRSEPQTGREYLPFQSFYTSNTYRHTKPPFPLVAWGNSLREAGMQHTPLLHAIAPLSDNFAYTSALTVFMTAA
jgi:hypothetical protein